MFRFLSILAFLPLIFACKKEEGSSPVFSEASYRVTVTGNWKAPEFSVPASAHFTTFAGMVHNNNINLWKVGNLASLGVENVAEVGNHTALLNEVDAAIANKNAISFIAFNPPSITGNVSTNIYLNSNYSLVSFVSMIAPSPDWFIGLSSLNLLNNNSWIQDTTIDLYVHDAGTEDGDVFGYSNPATAPQQLIRLLTATNGSVLANGNPALAPIATVRFVKL